MMELIGEGKILDLIELARKVGLSLAGGNGAPLPPYEEGKFLLKIGSTEPPPFLDG